jgi:hypothetical protein
VSPPDELSALERFFLAWVAFFRVLFDGRFAARVRALGAAPAPPAAEASGPKPADAKSGEDPIQGAREDGALQLLCILQEEGRFVDFVRQDITGHGDADVATAARVVHAGCRKAVARMADLEPVRGEDEGTAVRIPLEPSIKVVGILPSGSTHAQGTLVHRGWRATRFELPKLLRENVGRIVAPAEIEQ